VPNAALVSKYDAGQVRWDAPLPHPARHRPPRPKGFGQVSAAMLRRLGSPGQHSRPERCSTAATRPPSHWTPGDPQNTALPVTINVVTGPPRINVTAVFNSTSKTGSAGTADK